MALSKITNTLPKAHKLLQQAENMQWQQFWDVSIFGLALAWKGNSSCNILIPLSKRHNFEKKKDPPSTAWWVPTATWRHGELDHLPRGPPPRGAQG